MYVYMYMFVYERVNVYINSYIIYVVYICIALGQTWANQLELCGFRIELKIYLSSFGISGVDLSAKKSYQKNIRLKRKLCTAA